MTLPLSSPIGSRRRIRHPDYKFLTRLFLAALLKCKLQRFAEADGLIGAEDLPLTWTAVFFCFSTAVCSREASRNTLPLSASVTLKSQERPEVGNFVVGSASSNR